MNKKKEIDKLARLTILANFVSSKLKEQKDLVKSFINEEDKVLKGIEHKLNVIVREYERFDSESFRKEQPEVYKSYKTKLVRSVELKPIIDQEEERDSHRELSTSSNANTVRIIFGARAYCPRAIFHSPFSKTIFTMGVYV